MVNAKVFNVTASLNVTIDDAKAKAAKLAEFVSEPNSRVEETSKLLLVVVSVKLKEADDALKQFALDNGYDLP